MSDSREMVIRMYDSALRALDTKAQIFLAFLTLTLTPVFSRLNALETAPWIRVAEAGLFLAAAGAFVVCLYPRRGRRSAGGPFDTGLDGDALVAALAQAGNVHDPSATVATLHDIYRVKSRSVSAGVALMALYILTVAITLAVG